MKSLSLALAFGVLTLTAATSEAQEVLPVGLGSRVRVSLAAADGASRMSYPSHKPSDTNVRIGTIASISADTLVIREGKDGALHTIPIDSVARLEMSRGRGMNGRNMVAGALLGFAVGAAIGVATASKGSSCDENSICFEEDFAPMGGALVGGLGGALVGTLIGAAMAGERWQTVKLASPRSSFRLDASGRGLSASAQLRF
ncbi:MAG: hypothetical protein ABR543_16540 [Gemmatimonadaceae bacterium]